MLRIVLVATTLFSSVAAGAVTFSSVAFNPAPHGQVVVDNFDAPAPGVALSGSYTIDALSVSGIRAEPAGDTSNYFATPGSADAVPGTATIDFSGFASSHSAIKRLSFYWGSTDTYNTLTLLGTGLTGQTVFTGSDVNPPANGDQSAASTNRRVTFVFAPGEKVTGLMLSSGQRAFEIDDVTAAVPEPGVWAMLLAGFGLVGLAARARSRTVAA